MQRESPEIERQLMERIRMLESVVIEVLIEREYVRQANREKSDEIKRLRDALMSPPPQGEPRNNAVVR